MSIGLIAMVTLAGGLQAAGTGAALPTDPIKTVPDRGLPTPADARLPLPAPMAELGGPVLPATLASAKPQPRIESAPTADQAGAQARSRETALVPAPESARKRMEEIARQLMPDSNALSESGDRVYDLLNPNFGSNRRQRLAGHPVPRFFARARASLRDPRALPQDVALAARVAGTLASLGRLPKDTTARRRLIAQKGARPVDLTAGWLSSRGRLYGLYRSILSHPNATTQDIHELLRGLHPRKTTSAQPSLEAIFSAAERALFKLPADGNAFVLLLQKMRESGALTQTRAEGLLARYVRYAGDRGEKVDPQAELDVHVFRYRPGFYSEGILLALADADARLAKFLDPDFADHIVSLRFDELAAWANRYLAGSARDRVLTELQRKRAAAAKPPNPSGI